MTKIGKTTTTTQKQVKTQPSRHKAAKKAQNSILVGGIKYYSKDVKKVTISQISETDDVKESTFHDATKYEVTLKDGTKVTHTSHKYEDGSSNEKANLANKAEVQVENNGTVNFKGLSGAVITDTPKNDNYRFLGCEYTELNASRTEEKSLDFTDKVKSKLGFIVQRERKGKDKDNITIANRKLDNGKIQKSCNNLFHCNNGDIVNEKEIQADKKFAQDNFLK